MIPRDETSAPRRPRRRWAVGAASALAAAALVGGGTAVALQAPKAQPAQSPSAAASDPAGEESLASLTALDDVATDVTAVESAGAGAPLAQLAAVVAPAPADVAAAAGAAAPSPSATGGPHAPSAAKHPARAALRRALAVIIRQDGTAQYGQHAQTAARALVNRFPAVFRHLPEKLRQDLWTLAGSAAGQETADAQAIKNHALDGTYGDAVKKLAEAIQKAPAKAPATPQSGTPSATPTPSS